MPRVLLTRPTPGVYDLPGVAFVVASEGHFADHAARCAAVARHAPLDALVTMAFDTVDAALLDAAGASLKCVCNYAVGYENIDLEACRQRGVQVCITPDAVTEGTADMAWALLLAAARRVREAGAYARSPEYPARGPLGMTEFVGLDIAGRTLLIVGAGRIGRAVALRSLGWGMRVLYVARSRHMDFEFAPLNAERTDLDDGLRAADFVSVHTPLTDETRHLIDARRLALMKPSAVIVNTARGPIIDEAALAEALKHNRIFAAGLDVFEHEPRIHPELVGLPNAVLTPHIGSASRRSRALMAEGVVRNLRAALEGRDAPNRIV